MKRIPAEVTIKSLSCSPQSLKLTPSMATLLSLKTGSGLSQLSGLGISQTFHHCLSWRVPKPWAQQLSLFSRIDHFQFNNCDSWHQKQKVSPEPPVAVSCVLGKLQVPTNPPDFQVLLRSQSKLYQSGVVLFKMHTLLEEGTDL